MPASRPPSMEWLESANRLESVANQLASVVHEVNNMLQIISGSAEILGMSKDSPPAVHRRAEVIGAQAQRAAALLTDMLAFFRETSEPTSVDLRTVVSRALEMRRYALSQAHIDQHVELCAEEALVRVNPRRMLQVVLNLTQRGERALLGLAGARLEFVVTSEDGRVDLTVEDNSPQELRLDGELGFGLPVEDGTAPSDLGIGPEIAAWIVAREGGELSIGRGAGGGTAVRVSFPAA